MKKTHKKILGVLGLVLVAAITFIAAQIPSQNASATSVTDTITVRVVGEVAAVDITHPSSGTTNSPIQSIGVSYENAKKVTLTMVYTDKDGNTRTEVLWSDDTVDYNAGTKEFLVDFDNPDNHGYGYGDYVFTLEGVDINDAVSSRSVLELSYVPTMAEIKGDENTKDLIIDLDYDEDKVGKVKVDIYVGGVLVDTVEVESPEKRIVIPAEKVSSWGKGEYTFVITTYNKENIEIFQTIIERDKIPNTGVDSDAGAPNTGGLFQNLNISREDYLITGVLIFFVFAVVATGVILRSRSGKATMKRRK